jgi:F-type H+-transporting ATPase subunit b
MDFLDEKFWLAISFCIFIYFAYRPIKHAILNSLDERINNIKTKIVEAEKINQDADILFKKIENQMKELSLLKDNMLMEGSEIADNLVVEYTANIEKLLEKKKEDANNMLKLQISKSSDQIQSELSSKILDIVTNYLNNSKKQLDDIKISERLMNK